MSSRPTLDKPSTSAPASASPPSNDATPCSSASSSTPAAAPNNANASADIPAPAPVPPNAGAQPKTESKYKRWAKKGAKVIGGAVNAVSLCADCLEAAEVLEDLEL
ncbi:hypothetical protein AURDEDRAFT_123755 [Auricularia subglabra TFB-10046 SS5]|nr:hypothetical protein AURDEDRAFT_123755 [Auricularia subglabra TFB-10046 SS5]